MSALPSLRQLRFLVALADELHFGRAAERCFVTQSTLSIGLKELETNLGTSLAERNNRQVLLTPIGREIAERARRLLADAQDIVDVAAHRAGAFNGNLNLGTIPTIGPFLIPKTLVRLRAAWPQLRFYLREELTDSLIEGLVDGRLDLIIIALPYEIGDLSYEPLFEDAFQLAMPPGYQLADLPEITDRELEYEKLMLLERGHCMQGHALSAFPKAHLMQDESFAASSLPTLVSMVEEGLGITLLPQLSIYAGIGQGHDIALAALKGALPRKVILAWRKTSALSEDFRQLATVFRKAHDDLVRQFENDN